MTTMTTVSMGIKQPVSEFEYWRRIPAQKLLKLTLKCNIYKFFKSVLYYQPYNPYNLFPLPFTPVPTNTPFLYTPTN